MICSPKEASFRAGLVRSANRQRRDSAILVLRAQGRTVAQIASRMKVTERAVYMSLRRAGHDVQTLIAEEIQRESITPELILTRLSEMFNADFADIIEPAFQADGVTPNVNYGKYRPVEEWPPIWRRMVTAADTEEMFERSKDGGGSSWDEVGEVVKLKFIDPVKIIELAMKHKGVDAMAAQKGTIDMNVTVTAEHQRQVSAARRRLSRVIDTKPVTAISSGGVESLVSEAVREISQDAEHNT